MAKFNNIHDKIGLLAQINRCKNGVSLRDLSDAYVDVENDLATLITAGDVVAVDNPEDKDKTLFPRGEPFLVELEGNLFLPDDSFARKFEESEENDKNITQSQESSDEEEEEKQDTVNDEDAAVKAFNERKLKAKAAAQVVNVAKAADIVKIDVDPKKQVRRGEAVWVGGQWFRVDSRVRDLPLSEQPARAQAKPSVVMLKDLSKKNDQDGYIKSFNVETVPLDSHMTNQSLLNLKESKDARIKLTNSVSTLKSTLKGKNNGIHTQQHHLLLSNDLTNLTSNILNSSASLLRKRPPSSFKGGVNNTKVNDAITEARNAASNPYLVYSHARRHGCTKDVRDMYLATKADIPTDPLELYKVLKQTKLIEENEPMCRPPLIKKRMNVDNDGKPKKRRYYERKNQRFTNWHLHGTEIGAALARAAERQQQGKSVGDGGM